jgi:hypothetical protein
MAVEPRSGADRWLAFARHGCPPRALAAVHNDFLLTASTGEYEIADNRSFGQVEFARFLARELHSGLRIRAEPRNPSNGGSYPCRTRAFDSTRNSGLDG